MTISRYVDNWKIESGIPIPGSIHGGGPKKRYPFREMEVGESFCIPCTKDMSKKIQSSVAGATRNVKPMKFVTKFVEESDHRSGIRVWRIQ